MIVPILAAAGASLLGGLLAGRDKKTEQVSRTELSPYWESELKGLLPTLRELSRTQLTTPTLDIDYSKFMPQEGLSPYGQALASQLQSGLTQKSAQLGREIQQRFSNVSPALGSLLSNQARLQAQLQGAGLPFQALQLQREQDIQKAQLGAQFQQLANQARLQQASQENLARMMPLQTQMNLANFLANMAQAGATRTGTATNIGDPLSAIAAPLMSMGQTIGTMGLGKAYGLWGT